MDKFLQAPQNTQNVVRFICETKFEDLPKEVVENAKGRILDCIGVAFCGAKEPVGKTTLDFLRKTASGRSEAQVVGANLRTDVCSAAFANGILTDATDFNDYFILSHPSAGVVPALLPVAELVGASGKDMITAFVVGSEIYTKLNQVMHVGDWVKGFHASGILTTISAVATAGKLLKLDKEQMLMALGIASSTFTGVKRNFGSFTKPYHVGNSVEGGVKSALLASRGFTSHIQAFEGKEGYVDVFCDTPRWEYLGQLGAVWDLKETPAGIKPQPSCGTMHPAMNGVMQIMNEYHVTEDDVERVDIGFASGVNLGMHIEEPQDIYDGKVSVHYGVALVLHYHDWGLKYDTNECIWDPGVRALFPKIHMYHEEELDGEVDKDHADCHAMVTVTLKNGQAIRIHATSPNMNYEQIRKKFEDSTCNLDIITKERSDRIAELVHELERRDIRDLAPLLV